MSLESRILILRLGAIGDVVNGLVLANTIKRASPDCEIGWMVHPRSEAVLQGHPSVDRVHRIDLRRPRELAEELGRVRACRYDIVLETQRLFKSGLLALLSGAPRRIGFDFNRSRELSWLFTNEKIEPHDPMRHVVDQYMEFAAHLGIEDRSVQWLLRARPLELEKARARMEEKSRWVVLSIGAGKPANRWDISSWARLAWGIETALDARVCLVGGPESARSSRALAGLVPAGAAPLNLVGQTNLQELLGVLECADLVVSCDSGPMHMAVALGRPVVALFGPANHLRTGPYGLADRVIHRRDLWCSPCFRKDPCGDYLCMPGIDAARVLSRVEAALEEDRKGV